MLEGSGRQGRTEPTEPDTPDPPGPMPTDPPEPPTATRRPPPTGRARGRRRRAWVVATAAALAAAAGLFAARGELAARLDARAARAAVAAGRPEEALARIGRWRRARPGSAEAAFLEGEALAQLERVPEALAAFERARRLGYPESEMERSVGILLARVGRRDAAEPMLRRARERRDGPDPRLDEALARVYLETYRLGLALEALRRWAEAEPADPKPYLWKAEVDTRLGSAAGHLIDDYREALRRDPDLDEARLSLAHALRGDGQYEAAAAEFDRYLGRHPDDPYALAGAGLVAMARGRDAEAIARLDRALELDPENGPALDGRAALALRRGEFAAALPLLERARALDPDDPEVRYRLGMALDRLGRPDEARAEREAATRIRRELDEMDAIRKELVKSPRDPDLQYRAARWLLDHGHPEEALTWALRAVDAPGGHRPSARLLADYYDARGDAGRANFYRLQAGPPGP